MLTPAYVPQASGESPDVYRALYDFVRSFALVGADSLLEENIYRGWENQAALPATGNDYAVLTVVSSVRRGTTVEDMPGIGAADNEPEMYTLRTYYETIAQIDLCADDDTARQRALALESVFRSLVGTAFFKSYGIAAQYCNTVREEAFTDESLQHVKRYRLECCLGYWAGVDVGTAWFDTVTMKGTRSF